VLRVGEGKAGVLGEGVRNPHPHQPGHLEAHRAGSRGAPEILIFGSFFNVKIMPPQPNKCSESVHKLPFLILLWCHVTIKAEHLGH